MSVFILRKGDEGFESIGRFEAIYFDNGQPVDDRVAYCTIDTPEDQERALARFREPIEGIHFVDYMVESIVSLTHEAFGQRALVVEIMAEGMRNPQVAAMLKNKHMTITEFVAQRMRDAQQKGEISPDINTAMTSRLLLDLTYGVLADIEAEDLAREASFAQGLRAMIGGILTAS